MDVQGVDEKASAVVFEHNRDEEGLQTNQSDDFDCDFIRSFIRSSIQIICDTFFALV